PWSAAAQEAIARAEEEIRGKGVEWAVVVDADTGAELLKKTSNQVAAVYFAPGEVEAWMRNGRAVLTHNHPSSSILSIDDLILAHHANLAEIRSASQDGSGFRLLRPAAGWAERPSISSLEEPDAKKRLWSYANELRPIFMD